MPSEAVVVREPETMPSNRASWNLKMYLPMNMPRSNGIAVATMPQANRLKPSFCKPATKAGPDAMPMMAMKILRPTEFMNHTVGDGMRPKVGLTERSQPKNRPENRAPPAVDNVIGMPPTL